MFEKTGIPNCVPEYFRSRFEDEAHEYELEMERNEWYEKNRMYRRQKMIEGCNELDFYPDECGKCPCGEEASPDSEYDDIPVMICSNWKSCPVFRREMDERFPENKAGSADSWVSWAVQYAEKLKKENEEKGE